MPVSQMIGQPRQLPAPFFRFIDPELAYARGAQPKGASTDIMEAAEIAERERWLDCPQYEECLDHAATNDWKGFACTGCPRREP